MGKFTLILCAALFAVTAGKSVENDIVLQKFDDGGPRYQHTSDAKGKTHLVDLWMKASDVQEAARYNPDGQNIYHLFTRQNPSISQPLLLDNNGLLAITDYNPNKRTVVLIHGWRDTVTGDFVSVLVHAFLEAADVNVIVVDWSAGSATINYLAANANAILSGESVARFVNWLSASTGAHPYQYHLVGHGLGAHQVGVAGRNVNGDIGYITALDPSLLGWTGNENRFQATDGSYTEVIHTNGGILGYITDIGDVDFYPNGGISMPGCDSQECDHERSFYYLAESLSQVFIGSKCTGYLLAMSGTCFDLLGRLQMGGLWPKTGTTGVYWLETNDAPPFSRQ